MPGTVRPVADERDGLLAYLAQQRDGLRYAVHGLTDAQAAATPTVSALSTSRPGMSPLRGVAQLAAKSVRP